MNQEGQLRNRFRFAYHMLSRIVDPGPALTLRRERLRIQFISGLSLVAIPILVLAQIGSEVMPGGIPYYIIMGLIVFIAYLLSKTGHIDTAVGGRTA